MKLVPGKLYKAKKPTIYPVEKPRVAISVLVECKPFILIMLTHSGIIVLCEKTLSRPFAIYEDEFELFEELT